MSTYLKPQTPLYSKKNKAYVYPPTTSDQVIMPDGSRLTPDKLADMILDTATPDAIGALSMELLWENASPASGFGNVTINVSLSEGQIVFMRFRTTTSSPVYASSMDVIKQDTYGVCSVASGYSKTNIFRQYKLNLNNIAFEIAWENGAQTANALIPVEIYVIKGASS